MEIIFDGEAMSNIEDLFITIDRQTKLIAKLKVELNLYRNARDHVTGRGKTKRTFSTGEGWAMVHKDYLLDLECAAEQLSQLQESH